MSALAAVLFDMDGTLVDTEVLWWRTTEETAAAMGHTLTDADAPEVVGRAVEDTAAHLVRVTGGETPPGWAPRSPRTSSDGCAPGRRCGPAPNGC